VDASVAMGLWSLTGLLTASAVILPWGSRSQALACVGPLLSYPLQLAAGTDALTWGAGGTYLFLVGALGVFAASLFARSLRSDLQLMATLSEREARLQSYFDLSLVGARSEERRVGKECRDRTVTGVQTCALPIFSYPLQLAAGTDALTWGAGGTYLFLVGALGVFAASLFARSLRSDLQLMATLSEREARLQSYFDLSLVGAAILSPDGRCGEVNDELCRMFGYSRP